MASYQTFYYYYGNFSGNVFTPTLSYGANTRTFYSEDPTFVPQASIYISEVYPVTYIGSNGGGILVLNSGGHYFNTLTPLASMSPISINTTTPFVTCFLPGTLIATPFGDVAVQNLAIGDLVLTAEGRSVPVKWLGRQTVVTIFGPGPEHWPVHIDAGALGEGLPARPLRLTSDHALVLGGVLVQAGALVNGTTVRRLTADELGDRYTVFHVETENHEVIFAEGVPAETFVDNVTRRRFDNFDEYEAHYGDAVGTIAEMPLPRVKSARQLPQAIRAGLEARAAELGTTLTDAA